MDGDFPTSGRARYFAYGSNMPLATVSTLAPSHKVLGVAQLANHRLAFTRKSQRWEGGVADILPAKGISVFGVLYEIGNHEWKHIDKREGAPSAYERRSVNVICGTEPLLCEAYSVRRRADQEVPPQPAYLGQLIQGAQEHNLPAEYQAFLKYLHDAVLTHQYGDGFLLFPTKERTQSKGVPLVRMHPHDAKQAHIGNYCAIEVAGKCVLARTVTSTSVPQSTCEADQSIRTAWTSRVNTVLDIAFLSCE